MTANVKVFYEKFANLGIVPGTDYENSMMDEILDWADNTLPETASVDIISLIDLYWSVHLEGVEVGEYDAEVLPFETV